MKKMRKALAVAMLVMDGVVGSVFAVGHTVAYLAPEASSAANGGHTQYIKTGVRLTGDDRNTCTVELWVRPMTRKHAHHLAQMWSVQKGRQIFSCTVDGRISVWLGGYDDASIISDGTIDVDRWSHVAWVADGDRWRIYINGRLDAEESGHADHLLDQNAPYGLVIGNAPRPENTPNGQSDACYAEVRLWKCARTTEQIVSSMNKRLSQAWKIPDLVGYWPLSDGASAYAANGNRVQNHAAVPVDPSTAASQVADDMSWPSAGNYGDGNRVEWLDSADFPVEGSVGSDRYALYNLGGHTPPDWGDRGCHTNAVDTQISETAENFTFMGWYLVSDSSEGRPLNCLFARAHGLNGDTVLYEHKGKLTLSMTGRTATGSWQRELSVIVENAVQEHVWTHLAVVKRDTVLLFYINGELRARQENWDLTMPACNLHVGGTDQWGGRSFFGAFKNIGFWRCAMSERKVNAYMSVVPDGTEPDLIGYWPMDDGAGNAARNLKNPSVPAVPVGNGFFRWLRRANLPIVEGSYVPAGMTVVVR